MSNLQNGWNEEQYHRYNKNQFSGLNVLDGSNTNSLLKYLDGNSFTTIQNLEEMDKAHEIDYAHGLELDDIGDDPEISRKGIDDQTYRFYLKSHNLVKDSNGTFPDLINIAATLLGCDKQDVRLVETQQIDDNGKSTGEPDTIQIKNLDITKITNANLIPLLETEMQKAAAGSQRIEQIDFAMNEELPINMSLGLGFTYQFTI